jgi:chromate transport protein ChrA
MLKRWKSILKYLLIIVAWTIFVVLLCTVLDSFLKISTPLLGKILLGISSIALGIIIERSGVIVEKTLKERFKWH